MPQGPAHGPGEDRSGPRPSNGRRSTHQGESVMRRSVLVSRPSARRPRTNTVRPLLEGLEDRLLLSAANGGHWAYPARVTYSFMPDGTSIGGVSSALFSTLNAVTATATWQQQFQKA